MILCIAPNTAVDRNLIVPGFQPGGVFRAAESLVAAGGKGVNVARAARLLGAETLCMGFVGGYNGQLVADLARREGLQATWTQIESETRSCFILVDTSAHVATVVNEPGPTVSADEWTRFQADILRHAAQAESLCYCGSLPPGVPPERFADLLDALCRDTTCDLWIDTSGAPLRAAVELGM